MNEELIENVAWIGDKHLGAPIRGVVLSFAGLGGTAPLKEHPVGEEWDWANSGGLIVFPYYNPWAWMNPQTVAFVDELLDAIFRQYRLAPSIPVIATGGSMGGHAALSFAMNSRHSVTRCLAVSPVCDILFHYGERPDLPRTFHAAYGSYGDIRDALAANSPALQIEKTPRIPYLVVHGDQDDAVAKDRHSDIFVQKMRAAGRDVTYIEIPGGGHCGPLDDMARRTVTDFVQDGLL